MLSVKRINVRGDILGTIVRIRKTLMLYLPSDQCAKHPIIDLTIHNVAPPHEFEFATNAALFRTICEYGATFEMAYQN